MRRIAPLTVLFLLVSITGFHRAFGQHDLGLYNMQDVPQRITLNPSFIPEARLFVGIPVLSGIQSSYANPFTYNDVITRGSDDSLTLHVDTFLDKIGQNDQIRFTSAVDILSVGTKINHGKLFLGFSIRERASQMARIPVGLGNLLWYGNASPLLFGKTVNIAPELYFMAYDEWGASVSGWALSNRLSWGVRLKYLSGRFDATTSRASFGVYTDTSTYMLYMQSDIEIRTSGIDGIENYFDQRVTRLVFPGNNGFGIDLGATFRINDRISLNAGVQDIGFIVWKSDVTTITSRQPGETFVFNGVHLEGFMDMIADLNDFGKKLTDSITDLVELDTIYGGSYTSWLPARFNLGGSYRFTDRHGVNVLLEGVAWHQTFHPALSISYNFRLKPVLGILASYNLFNNQYTNVGAGLDLTFGPVQLYAVTDNLPGIIFYRHTNNYSVQFGINLLFGEK